MTTIRRLAWPIALLLAAVAGYALGRGTSRAAAPTDPPGSAAQQVYTCSMHPQVRLDRPGTCPICEMPLIPAGGTEVATAGPPSLRLSERAVAMASIETAVAARRPLARELRAVGKVEFNEAALATITPRVGGYAERLFVDFTGVTIRKGDHLAEIYSPELFVAQQELLIALQGGSGPLVDTGRTKLKLLGLTDAQVQKLVDEKEFAERITLFSPISGTVIEKLVVEQAAFAAGEPLYRIADLSTVWVYVDVYEYDLPWLRYGQRVAIAAEALPCASFTGTVTFVQPIVNELTRTIRVPVHVVNEGQRLKPGMFVSVAVRAALGSDGEAMPTGVEGKYTCAMHPQVLVDAAGKCPTCEMALERIPGTPAGAASPDAGVPLAIPVTAVLDSGLRRLVYVEREKGLYEPREVVLGPRAGDDVPVKSGLAAGERVVVRGNFLLDSQFQITGHPSLLYPGGLHASMGHDHGAAPAPGAKDPAPAPVDPHAGHKR